MLGLCVILYMYFVEFLSYVFALYVSILYFDQFLFLSVGSLCDVYILLCCVCSYPPVYTVLEVV